MPLLKAEPVHVLRILGQLKFNQRFQFPGKVFPVGKLGIKLFNPLSGQNVTVLAQPHPFFPPLDKVLVGISLGETFQPQVSFPPCWHQPTLLILQVLQAHFIVPAMLHNPHKHVSPCSGWQVTCKESWFEGWVCYKAVNTPQVGESGHKIWPILGCAIPWGNLQVLHNAFDQCDISPDSGKLHRSFGDTRWKCIPCMACQGSVGAGACCGLRLPLSINAHSP